jgi:hypothetical protein
MAITKDSNRQGVLVVHQPFTWEDLGDGAITTTTVFDAIQMPANAIVVGGQLVITTVWDSSGTTTVSVGDGGSAARYLGDTSIKSAARTALVPTGYKYTAGDTIDLDLALATGVATAGEGYLEVEYIIDGRSNENQG